MHDPQWSWTDFVDSPVGGETPVEVGPDFFDTLKDAQGRFRTQSLFWETRHESYPAYFTLKRKPLEKDGKIYISLYEKYMEIADPTEYQVAVRLFDSWEHWVALCKTKWFKEHVDQWRAELRTKLESERYHEMKKEAAGGNVQATKWLAERYNPQKKVTPKRGRPSKEEKAAHLKAIEQEREDLADDAKRLGIVANAD